MAYQFSDGFDNYGNAYSFTNGYPWDTAANGTTSTADFRFSPPGSLPGGCVQVSGSGNVMKKILSSAQATLIVGFGFKLASLPGSGQSNLMELCSFWDSSTEQLCLAVNNNGALQFYRGGLGGTAIGAITANATIAANAWYGIQMQVTINSSTGAVTAYLNGVTSPIISSTGLNTQSSGNAQATQVGIGPTANAAPQVKYDDFFIFDSTGGVNNAWTGSDARILSKMPSGAGTYTNWTPNGLGSNFQNAAVQPPSTSDYNANNVATTKDSYNTQSASLAVAPYFVVVRASMEKDDGTTHTPSIFVRSSSTDSAGVVTPALGASYLFYDAVFPNDPNTSAPWTGPAADAAQIGVIEG